MAENSKIEWTHHTFQAWEGCTKVSPGCANCYAEARSKRFGRGWGPKEPRKMMSEAYWKEPLRWNREAKEAGERRRVFCASLADVFEGDETMPEVSRPLVAEARRRLFMLAYKTKHLDWLFLTKRPQNIQPILSQTLHADYPHTDWWFGTSVENQETADERIPHLLRVPSIVRFLSCEPLLGPVDLKLALGSIDWVIAGGESGANARPMHPDWARSLRNQCQAAGVAFHFKQWGEWQPGAVYNERLYADRQVCMWPNGGYNTCAPDNPDYKTPPVVMQKVGKAQAGRLLDGRTWDELPEVGA